MWIEEVEESYGVTDSGIVVWLYGDGGASWTGEYRGYERVGMDVRWRWPVSSRAVVRRAVENQRVSDSNEASWVVEVSWSDEVKWGEGKGSGPAETWRLPNYGEDGLSVTSGIIRLRVLADF